jgi:hypothetical protein
MAGRKRWSRSDVTRLDGLWDDLLDQERCAESGTDELSVEDLYVSRQDLESLLSGDFEPVDLMPVVCVDERGAVTVKYVPRAPADTAGRR